MPDNSRADPRFAEIVRRLGPEAGRPQAGSSWNGPALEVADEPQLSPTACLWVRAGTLRRSASLVKKAGALLALADAASRLVVFRGNDGLVFRAALRRAERGAEVEATIGAR